MAEQMKEIKEKRKELKAKIEKLEMQMEIYIWELNEATYKETDFYLDHIDACRKEIAASYGLLTDLYKAQQQELVAAAGCAQTAPELASSLSDAPTPCFVNPDMSASYIAFGDFRTVYDVFAPPCSPESYIPNGRTRALLERFQQIRDTDADIHGFEHILRTEMRAPHSWEYSTDGLESNISDSNLRQYLSLINERVPSRTHLFAKEPMPFPLVMAKQSSQVDYRIQYDNVVLIVSDAKGLQDSMYEGWVQGLQGGGDSAVDMWRRGFDSKDAVVPVVLSYSDCFCIYAVYLIPHCYPVIVQLSSPMTYLTLDGRICIARWGIALAWFVEESVSLLLKTKGREPAWDPGLYIQEPLFFKPIRHFESQYTLVRGSTSMRADLELTMTNFRKISVIDEADRYFLFPLGVVSYPSSKALSYHYAMRTLMHKYIRRHFVCSDNGELGCPVVVFEYLNNDEWSNSKPPQDIAQSYVNCVAEAVRILNMAGIAHMDLRPANIMWRRISTGEAVEIRVIDLEDAIPFGFLIQHVKILRTDPRYPVLPTDTRKYIPAEAWHNDWFLKSVTAWATRDVPNDFTSFMFTHWPEFANE